MGTEHFVAEIAVLKAELAEYRANVPAMREEIERLRAALEAIAEVGSGYGGRKVEEEKMGYSTTTGEGHQECRQIADAALKQ